MNKAEKAAALKMRAGGMKYDEIAKWIGAPVGSVKSACSRARVAPVRYGGESRCEQCGSAMAQPAGRKRKRFCCDRCRNAWWNAHRGLVRSGKEPMKCAFCGKEIKNPRKGQRFCSSACYFGWRKANGGKL